MKATPEHIRISQINAQGVDFMGWVNGYSNGTSRCVVRCTKCDHVYESSVTNIVNARSGCVKCKGLYRYTPDEYAERINQSEGVEFVKWDVEGVVNSFSKARVRCCKGHEWIASVNSLLSRKSGCPRCHPRSKYTLDEYIDMISKIERVTYVRLKDEFRSSKSKIILSCDEGHEWETNISHIINKVNPSRCPTCAKYGFKRGKLAYLYILISNCGGYIKVGITNNLSQRVSRLRSNTPFNFELMKAYKGDGCVVLDEETRLHRVLKSASMRGFSGCTEWFEFDYNANAEINNIHTGLKDATITRSKLIQG